MNKISVKDFSKGQVIVYRNKVEVRLHKETVWLDAHQMAVLFGVNRPAVVKHINNIYKTDELDKKSTCSILEQVAADGNKRIAAALFICFLQGNGLLSVKMEISGLMIIRL